MTADDALQHIAPVAGPEGALMREVFARYGKAMYDAQVLEHGVVNALMVLKFLPTMRSYTSRAAWEAAFDRFYDEELTNTFGTMLKRLLQPGIVSALMAARLQEAKRRRDKLAHAFFREHDESVFSIAGKIEMLDACKADSAFFQAVDDELEAETSAMRECYGITEAWVEDHLGTAIARGRRRDSERRSS